MDPVENPFAPSAGTRPPQLAGRDEPRETIRIAIERTKRGLPTKSSLLIGLRGVGKTVLLDCTMNDALSHGVRTLRIEAPEDRSLPALLAPQLRLALLELSRNELVRAYAERALRALAGFAKSLKAKYGDIEVGLDFDTEPGLADNGDLEHDLQALMETVGEAAQKAGTALALFIDELQYVKEAELAALITALHRASQRRLPLILVGAGLPQLTGKMGKAKSYAERLFEFQSIDALPPEATKQAIEAPLTDCNVSITSDALDLIVTKTKGYPYFIQEWGKHTWDVATTSPITLQNVEEASNLALAALDESFFRVRFDRLTPMEKTYLRAMADLNEEPYRSGDIASVLQRDISSLAPLRASLIKKGMIWSPRHGDTAFTVPLFAPFMRRMIPNLRI